MRITFVTRQCWPAVGGVETVVENLGGALQELGHDVSIVAQAIDEMHFGRMTHIVRERMRFAPFAHNGMSAAQFRPSRRRRALLLPLAWELIPFGGGLTRKWVGRYSSAYYSAVVGGVLRPLLAGADVVHVLGSNMLAVAAVEAAHALGSGVAISPFAHLGEWGDDSVSIRAYTNADALLATTRADAEGYLGLGVPTERVHVVGLPVPDALASEHAGDPPIPRDVPVVLYLGQRRPTKRVDLLLAACGAVWERHPDTHFAFVGPGSPLPIRDDRILDVGRVSDAERSRWLARAELLCLPSSSETFGMVVGEAWSARVPVVVSDIPILQELVSVSRGGVVASGDPESFAHAISSMLGDAAGRRAMGEAGHDYWRTQLRPTVIAEQHLAVYRALEPSSAGLPLSVT